MRRRRRSRRTFWSSLSLLLLGVGGAVALAVCLAQPDAGPAARLQGRTPEPREAEPDKDAHTPKLADLPKEVQRPESKTRRLKVGGAEDFYIVINPDGSSILEGPGGQRTPLAGAGELNPPPEVLRKAEERLKPPVPPKKEVGQLIVCDDGVVDVPTDAIITFVGKDKVVTHDPSGASVVYYVSGKVEHRGRAERDGWEEAASPRLKRE